MKYAEFTARLAKIGSSPAHIALEAGWADPRRSADNWSRVGVPTVIVALLKAWETIEFQRKAIAEFNARLAELQIHSAELAA